MFSHLELDIWNWPETRVPVLESRAVDESEAHHDANEDRL